MANKPNCAICIWKEDIEANIAGITMKFPRCTAQGGKTCQEAYNSADCKELFDSSAEKIKHLFGFNEYEHR